MPITKSAASGFLVDRNLTLWVHTEERWHGLEASVGLKLHELGRFKEWAALRPKHFSEGDYNLDKMIRWARASGTPYTEERAVHYSGTTGHVLLGSAELVLNPPHAHRARERPDATVPETGSCVTSEPPGR